MILIKMDSYIAHNSQYCSDEALNREIIEELNIKIKMHQKIAKYYLCDNNFHDAILYYPQIKCYKKNARYTCLNE